MSSLSRGAWMQRWEPFKSSVGESYVLYYPTYEEAFIDTQRRVTLARQNSEAIWGLTLPMGGPHFNRPVFVPVDDELAKEIEVSNGSGIRRDYENGNQST